jgi:hypothetical protein
MTAVISPEVLAATRQSLHQVAEHLLAATRKRATGEITLVQGAGGFRTIAQAADFTGVPAGFSWTKHPPATPFEPDASLALDEVAAAALADWFRLGQQALSMLVSDFAAESPSEPALFPEHFDLGITAGSVNYGFSPGDDAIAEPYVYVGPHQLPPPAAGDFWNASFGAYRTWSQVTTTEQALDFLRAGHSSLPHHP